MSGRDLMGDLRGNNSRGGSYNDMEMGRISPAGSPRIPSRTNGPSSAPGSPMGGRSGSGGGDDSEADYIQKTIDRVNANLRVIEQLHSRALTAVSPEETARLTHQVDQAQDETNRLLQDTRNRLQNYARQTNSGNGRDSRVRKAKQSALAKNLMRAAETYQKIQSKYRKEYRKRMEREIRIARPNATPEEIERAMDSRTGPVFAQEILSSRVQDQRRVLQEVQGRHEELRRIETSIDELVNLFQEMQLLIDTQQDMIDTIDTHVEASHTHVQAGSTEVSKAIDYRVSSRKKLWWVVVLVIILLIVLAIVLYIYVAKPIIDKNNQPPPK